MAQGRPAVVEVKVVQVHYKNPIASALIGSANSVSSTVKTSEPDGANIREFLHSTQIDVPIQGVIGAVQALIQDDTNVDRKLASEHAKGLRLRIFGEEPLASPVIPAPPSTTVPLKEDATPVS
ncbi:MAG: hypothetical protein AAGB11_09310 [Pseudomonadota bacterium]